MKFHLTKTMTMMLVILASACSGGGGGGLDSQEVQVNNDLVKKKDYKDEVTQPR